MLNQKKQDMYGRSVEMNIGQTRSEGVIQEVAGKLQQVECSAGGLHCKSD